MFQSIVIKQFCGSTEISPIKWLKNSFPFLQPPFVLSEDVFHYYANTIFQILKSVFIMYLESQRVKEII